MRKRLERIFEGQHDGYMIVLPQLMINGDFVCENREPGVWTATETEGDAAGTGDSPQTALLALILDRLGYRVDGDLVMKDDR